MREPGNIFRNRAEAGRRLGACLLDRQLTGDVVVLGLPRGGVPVACELAQAIGAPADVLVVRKLGAPSNPELALGSIASGGITVYNRRIIDWLGLDQTDLAPIIEREQQELHRREQLYRVGREPPTLAGRTVVLVDDGAATGATMQAAVEAVRAAGAKRVIVALPTSSPDAAARLESVADEVVALSTPEPYRSVGSWYLDFEQLSDADVASWLDRGTEGAAGGPDHVQSADSQ